MGDCFVLTKATPVYLYGAASIGKIVYERNQGLHICGFLDARAEEIGKFMGLPVYTIAQAAGGILKENAVIMISVKNVFELEDIAVSLSEAGFHKLIYKSRAVLEGKGDSGEIRLSETWDALVEGSFCINSRELPCFQEKISYDFVDHAVLSEEGEDVLANIPVELIYTNNRRDKWADLNIQGYFPHIYFFYYLSNHKNGQIEDYMRFVEETAIAQGDIMITEAWKKNVLRNRCEVYENMRLRLDLDPEFFHRNAPTAVWNEKGYFNLTSGKHRCAFLVSQGYRYIALKLKGEEYKKFLAFEDAENIRNQIVEKCIHYISSKVYHPWFYYYPCKEAVFYSQFQVEALCRMIRLADEYGRKVSIYTDISRENSLYRILNQCRLVKMLEKTELKSADIILQDELVANKDKLLEKYASDKRVWCIGMQASGTVLTEYYSAQGTVYLCEKGN